MCLVTNDGEKRPEKMEMYHDLRVWFSSVSKANILSFSEVAKNHRSHTDTAKDKDILVETKKDDWMRFS